jgi:hypothetical protein
MGLEDGLFNQNKERLKKDSLFLLQNLFVHTKALLKSVNTAAGINQLLSACEEGVALGANFYADFISSRLGLESSTASTFNGYGFVLGMDILFHDFHLCLNCAVCLPLSK